MAHILQIPMAFEYRPSPRLWNVAFGEIAGWSFDGADNMADLKLPGMSENEAIVVEMNEIAWPAEIQEQLEVHECPDIRAICQEYPVEVLVSKNAPGKKTKVQDAWELRREFFKMKQDTTSLLGFLNKWGKWKNEGPVFPSEVWESRETYQAALTGSGPWFGHYVSVLSFLKPRKEYPHFVLQVDDCERAIQATITFDLLRRTKFSLCARKDCRAPFAIESKHKKKFCCQYCAHLESVRRQRKQVKKGRRP